MTNLIYLIILLIVFSFICSMVEAAILSVPFLRVRILFEQKRRGSKDLMYVKENIALSVASIVIVNNCINIIGSMYVGQQVSVIYGSHWLGVASALLTFLIIILGEIIPKALGEQFKVPVSLLVAKGVRWLTGLLQPFVKVSASVLKLWTPDAKASRVTEEEIMMMIKIGRESGTVETDEAELCNRIFRLKDIKATQIMQPLKEELMLPANQTLGELKDKIIDSRYNRIVVFDRNPSDVVGIVQHRLLLREIARDNYTSKVSQFMLQPIFVNHMIKLDALMEKFQSFHQHLFIVKDNLGKSIGLVTMEDVLEELFGEIYDEKDIRFKNLAKGPIPPLAIFLASLLTLTSCAHAPAHKKMMQIAATPQVTGSVLNAQILKQGGNIALVPFKAGPQAEATDELDRLSLAILKGIKENLQEYPEFFHVVEASDGQPVIALQGYVEEFSKVSSMMKGHYDNLTLVGEVWLISTGERILTFSTAKKFNPKKQKPQDAAYALGKEIGNFIVSNVR